MHVDRTCRHLLVACLVAVVLVACGYPSTGGDAGTNGPLVIPPGQAGKALQDAMKYLPEDVGLLISLDSAALSAYALAEASKILGVEKQEQGAIEEMGALLKKRLGIDPMSVDTLLVFELEGRLGALAASSAPVKGFTHPLHKEHQGVPLVVTDGDLWSATFDGQTVLGELPVVKAVLDANKDKDARKLAGSGLEKQYRELSKAVGEGHVVMVLGTPILEKLTELLPDATIEGVAYSLDTLGGGTLLVKADADTRKLLLAKLEEGRNQTRTFIKEARKELDRIPLHQALAIIYADHHLDQLSQRFEPVEKGDFLRLDLRGPNLTLLAALSATSVLAVPVLIKQARRAKTAEAIDMLDKIYKGAADYYSTPRVRVETAEKLPCQFPADQPPTPAGPGCCGSRGGADKDMDGRCDTNPAHWTTDSWSALKFQITNQHYFVYSFDSNGKTGKEAQFTATAYGDLDCDGIWSTFQRYGKGDPYATMGECSVVSAAALFTYQETE